MQKRKCLYSRLCFKGYPLEGFTNDKNNRGGLAMASYKIEYDNIIKNKDDLIKQLESLKEEAIYMLKNPYHYEIFQKDLHALKIVINMIKEVEQ